MEKLVEMYQVFSTQIELLASLINAKPNVKGKVLWDTTVSDLLVVVTYSRVEPSVLTSVCYLVNQVMQAINDPEMREASAGFVVSVEMETRVNRMQNCELLLSLLGFHEDPNGKFA